MKQLIVKIDSLDKFYKALITQYIYIEFKNQGNNIIAYDSIDNSEKLFFLKLSDVVSVDTENKVKIYDIIGLHEYTKDKNYISFVNSFRIILLGFDVDFEIRDLNAVFKIDQKVYNSETKEYGIITEVKDDNVVVEPFIPKLIWNKNDIEIVGEVELGGTHES